MEAKSQQELTFNGNGDVPTPKEFRARVYRNDDRDEGGRELYLGKMIMEKEGSLLIIGGKGESGSVKESQYTFVLIQNLLESITHVVTFLQL